jgi:hypothetical protein
MMSLHQDFKLGLYSLLCHRWEDKSNILNGSNPNLAQKLNQIWDGDVPKYVRITDKLKEVLSLIYYMFKETGRFVAYKTFMNDEWEEIFERFYTTGNFIKNLCEDNCTYFKIFMGNFKPSMSIYSSFENSIKRNLVEDLFKDVRIFFNYSICWLARDDRLCMADRPELFIVNIRLIEIVTELVNGPCW